MPAPSAPYELSGVAGSPPTSMPSIPATMAPRSDQGLCLLEADGAASELAELEVRLTLGLIRFVADLGQGRTARPMSPIPELFVFREEVREGDGALAASLH